MKATSFDRELDMCYYQTSSNERHLIFISSKDKGTFQRKNIPPLLILNPAKTNDKMDIYHSSRFSCVFKF